MISFFILTSCLMLSGCIKNDNKIESYHWSFDNIQSAKDNGEIIACSSDSKWVSDSVKIISLTIQVNNGKFTISNEEKTETYTFSYKVNNAVGKSTIYDIECNDTRGYATVGKTTYFDKTSVPTLIVSISDYNLYFYDVINK